MTLSDSLKILSLRISSSFGDDAFVVQKAVIEEQLSNPYLVEADLYTADESFDGDSIINESVAIIFQIYGGDDGDDSTSNERNFHGIVSGIKHVKTIEDTSGNLRHYFKIQIRPSFWKLKFGRTHKIFQEQSAIDIIGSIFDDNGITDFQINASGGTTVREYCVQYGETNFDFVSRLLEEEGITYFFTHTDSTHTMVLVDKNSSFEDIPQSSLNYISKYTGDIFIDTIYQFGKKSEITASAYKALDFNYKTPNTQLLSSTTGEGFGDEIYEYPGLFDKANRGSKLSDMRMEELEWFANRVYGSSTAPNISPGLVFTLKKHPLTAYNKKYVISYVKHEIESFADETDQSNLDDSDMTYKNNFEGFLKSIPYRPLRKTLKPRIYGSQTAFVTGSGTEVYSDSMARIKVKFHWDLENPDDETSSLWVRVSQTLSGSSWGALYMPRIGMEVVVSFIDGDPDRPIVTGCVYNQSFMPPYSPESVPHYMTIKSKTFDDDAGFNEFRFSDEAGNEEIYTHAQYDMNTVIENSRTENIIAGDDTLTMDEGNKKIHQKGSGTTYLTLINEGDRTTKLKDGDFVIDVTGTILIKASDDITIKTPTNIIMKAGENIVMKAGENIKGKAGENIKLKAGDDINGKAGSNVTLKAGTDFTAKAGADFTAKAGNDMMIKAGNDIAIKSGNDILAKAATSLSIKSPQIAIKADTKLDIKTATMMAKADTMLKLESGATAIVKSGAMLQIKAGATLMAEGGAMGMFKGAITKLG